MDATIKGRLTAYLRLKGVNNSEFGRRIGVSNSYISAMRKSIQPEKVKRIALEFPDLSIDWLITGEGSMLVGQPGQSSTQATAVASTVSSFSRKTLEERIAELEHQNAVLTRSLDLLTRQLEALLAERQKSG